jgi:hypothetical protein
LVETRSSADLMRAVSQAAFPIVLIDSTDRVSAGLEDLARAVRLSPDALTLLLVPKGPQTIPWLARELGATHVFKGTPLPPRVTELLERWLNLARVRSDADGWAPAPPGPPEPWEGLLPVSAG